MRVYMCIYACVELWMNLGVFKGQDIYMCVCVCVCVCVRTMYADKSSGSAVGGT